MTHEPDAEHDAELAAVVHERRHLINLAYRLLGSLAEAEDAVQETYARWYAMTQDQRDAVETPAAWLTKVASRVCLDVLGSARARRERYVGPWLPEPLPERSGWASVRRGPGTDAGDPADRVTLDESVGMAFLVALEAMTPAQRVALVLHDVFGYAYAEIADITGRTPAACRQLASSARLRVRDTRRDALSPTTAPHHAGVIREFRDAWQARDIGALVGLLDPEAVFTADGGGVVRAAPHPIQGAERIARYVVDLADRSPEPVTIAERVVNGQPGLSVERGGAIAAVYAFDVAGGRVWRIWAVRNPEKLRGWSRRRG